MKKNFNVKRKGFTLVELLIVIVVIGILSAMMMLSSTEAVSSAKASNVVSNLRNLKTAALAYYVDHIDEADKTSFDLSAADVKTDILKYMSSSSNNAEAIDGSYSFSGKGGPSAAWLVTCTVSDARVRAKLDGRKDSVGLVVSADTNQYSMKIR